MIVQYKKALLTTVYIYMTIFTTSQRNLINCCVFRFRLIFMSICRNDEVAITLTMAVIVPVEVHQKWIYSNQRWKSITKHHTHQLQADPIEHQINL